MAALSPIAGSSSRAQQAELLNELTTQIPELQTKSVDLFSRQSALLEKIVPPQSGIIFCAFSAEILAQTRQECVNIHDLNQALFVVYHDMQEKFNQVAEATDYNTPALNAIKQRMEEAINKVRTKNENFYNLILNCKANMATPQFKSVLNNLLGAYFETAPYNMPAAHWRDVAAHLKHGIGEGVIYALPANKIYTGETLTDDGSVNMALEAREMGIAFTILQSHTPKDVPFFIETPQFGRRQATGDGAALVQ
jgi:hypothetical protein